MSTIRELREAAGLTQVGLAERVGISESTVQKLERGEVLPSYKTLQRLRTVLGDDVLSAEFNETNRRDRRK